MAIFLPGVRTPLTRVNAGAASERLLESDCYNT